MYVYIETINNNKRGVPKNFVPKNSLFHRLNMTNRPRCF